MAITKTFSSIYMEEELKEKLRKLSEIDNRSLNGYINLVLEQHADKQMPSKKNKLVLKRRTA